MKGEAIRGRGLVAGRAEGSPLISARAFTFAHGVDPATGQITDVRSDIRGAKVGGRILCYPYGKGSTTASAWFMETVRCGNAPAALVTEGVDLSAVIGSVLAGLVYGKTIPVLCGIQVKRFLSLSPDSIFTVDGEAGEVIVKG